MNEFFQIGIIGVLGGVALGFVAATFGICSRNLLRVIKVLISGR